MSRVKDKVALVTGGRRGLGEASAVMLAREGAKVAITDRKEDGAEIVLNKIKSSGGEAVFIQQDVSKEEDWKNVIQQVKKQFGRLDILVNNAGVGAGKNIEELTLEDWRWVMSVNLDGVFLGTKYAIESMKTSGGGSIINMSSIEGMVGDRRLAAYAASKGGLLALTHALAISLGPDVRVNCISPGWILTKGPAPTQEEHAFHPAGRVGVPKDIAALAAFLLGPESGFITGGEFIVDGGVTRRMIYPE
jgi:NAD(P)-dependent dehydrogenase (short-subunit alcohol dehydrogenase family)